MVLWVGAWAKGIREQESKDLLAAASAAAATAAIKCLYVCVFSLFVCFECLCFVCLCVFCFCVCVFVFSLTGLLIEIKGANAETRNDIVRVNTYFIEQHKQHDDTTRVACNITKTATMMMMMMMMMMMRLVDVDHHARYRERRSVSTSPEARG